MRSRTGCQTCRQRKLKCDETKPVCGQCRKATRDCQPSSGIIFRHQQNASMNGADEVDDGDGRLGGFYAYKNTFNENNVWVDVPKTVTFYNVTDPYNMVDTPEPELEIASPTIVVQHVEDGSADNYFQAPFEQAPGLEALSAAATSNFRYQQPRPASLTAGRNASPQSSNNLNFILNPAASSEGSMGRLSPSIDPALMAATLNQNSGLQNIDDHEVAFLLRHYSEAAGQWMDLFDLGCYFSNHVPIQALSNPLLKFSACAYAAKQLGRVGGRKAIMGGLGSRQADMELYPRPETVDWAYVGAKYYDRAISLLMEELSHSSSQDVPLTPITSIEDTLSPHDGPNTPGSDPRSPGNKRRRISRASSSTSADETIAAGAILCVYEFLDNANSAWARHLSGTKSLFDLAESEGMMPVQSPTSPGAVRQRLKPSRSRRAAFWNFARQDFLAALINEVQTRLNTADLDLWRLAGLQLDAEGFVMPSNTEESRYPDRQTVMREDMISNALIFLMSKIINFLASGDSIDHVFPQNRASPSGMLGINQMLLLERWKELEKELEIWRQGLPITFQPCVRLPPVTDGSVDPSSPRAIFSEIWHSMPMCASTMQSYHMARILLLINRPHESTVRRSTLSERLLSYRAIELEVRLSSHEIIGIALARPESAVRIHQVQPLFVAGQCLSDDRERRVLLNLLRAVETDLGWATDYRAKQLLKDWGWDEGLS